MRTSTNDVLQELKATIPPDRLLVSGPEYAKSARVWNGAINHHPAVVVRPQSTADVQAAVLAARNHQLGLSVRGGGHDVVGRSVRDDGLVIDLSGLRHVTVDPATRIATVAGGALTRDVVDAATPHGLVAATGFLSSVGMAGLTLGGGYGPLNGRFGLALDNLAGAELVLPDGRLVTADAEREPDLFWALRGGGGNFGVVTSLSVQLHDAPLVAAGMIVYPWDQAETVWTQLRDILPGTPDELTIQSGVVTGPDGQTALFVSPVWCGDLDQGEKAIDELTRLGTPVHAQLGRMPYGAVLSIFDGFASEGSHFVTRTRNLAEIGPDAIAVLLEAGTTKTSPYSAMPIHHFHGAATRVAPDATAFGERREHNLVEIIATWAPGDGTEHIAWADSVSAALRPLALPGGYPNMLVAGQTEQVEHAYGVNAERLQRVKAQYDPHGVFTATPLPGGEQR